MKAVVFADYHIGVETHGRFDPVTGLNQRTITALKVLDAIIDYGIEHGIKLLLFPGDAYKNRTPSPTLQREFNKRILRARDAGMIVILLAGNHDVSKIESKSHPIEMFRVFNTHDIYATKDFEEFGITIDGESVRFITLPTNHTPDLIRELVSSVNFDGRPIVYLAHTTIKGAMYNDFLEVWHHDPVEAEVFQQPGVVAAMIGHLHKYQVLLDEPLVLYTGSPLRIDFTEEKQAKGFVVLDIDVNNMKASHEFIEVESQKFLTIDVNVVGDNDLSTDKIINEVRKNSHKIKDAITRVRITYDKYSYIDDDKIIKFIESFEPHALLKLQKRRNAEQSKIISKIDSSFTPETALEAIIDPAKLNRDKIIAFGKDLITELRNEGKIL